MLLSSVRSSWDILARKADLYFEVRANSFGFRFRSAARLLDFLVLAFRLGFCRQVAVPSARVFVGLLQLFLLHLQFDRQLLRLFQ